MKKSYLKYLLHAAILIGLIIAGIRYLNGEEILKALRTFNYVYAPWMLVLSTAYIILKAYRFVLLMRPLSNLHWSILIRGYVAGTAATLLPGGVAARAGLMKQVGVPVSKSGAPVAFSSILDQAVFVAGALLAALWFEAARTPAIIILSLLAGLGLIFLIPTTRGWLARTAEWVARKFKVLEKWQTFLKSVQVVATPKIMFNTFLLTVIGLVMQIVILDICLRGFGLALPYATLFLAYVLPTMLGRNSGLPAGVGVTEAGMVGFLASAAQIDPELAAAASAIFRIATVFFQALLGALVYFFGWRGEKEVDSSAIGVHEKDEEETSDTGHADLQPEFRRD